jgi:DNA-binding transcriptional MocR family regulator
MLCAQQYNLTLKGHPPLLKWVTEHTHQLHSPSTDHDIIITGGRNYNIEVKAALLYSTLSQLTHTGAPSRLCQNYCKPSFFIANTR